MATKPKFDAAKSAKEIKNARPVRVKNPQPELANKIQFVQLDVYDSKRGFIQTVVHSAGKKPIHISSKYEDLNAKDRKVVDEFISLASSL